MNDNYHAARMVTLTLFMGAGILSLGSCILKQFDTGVDAIVILTWVFGFILLSFLNEKRGVRPGIYCTVFNILLLILVIGYCFTFDNVYLLLFGFFVECIACTLFLDIKSCHYMLYANMVALLFFAVIPKDNLEKYMRISEVVVAACVYIVCTWISVILIRLVMNRDRRNLEQAQSLDDLLKVVEAKCYDAENANHAKSDFLAKMSHEIRTPINAVLGLDTMILRESREVHTKNYAMDIQNEGQILLSLINDILDLSKIESGKLEISPVEYELSALLNDVYNMVYFKAEEKDIEVAFIIDENIPSKLFGDDVRIRQILTNILNNAVKYTEKGTVTLKLEGRMDENAVILSFSVTDTGIGIKQEDIKRLFAEYERIEDVRTRYVEGTGLGMSITMSLLEMMNSELQVASKYGVGSTFSFELRQPVMDLTAIGNLQERLKSKTTKYAYSASFIAPDVKILVVDDNYSNRNVFINLLKETQVQIDQAQDGYECLKMVEKNRYDIIFLDHMMPGIDGIETLKLIKKMKDCPNADTPIIALTANAISGAREMYLSEGFDSFMSKPIRPDQLEHLICESLGIEIEDRAVEVSQSNTEIGRRLMELDGIDWDYAMINLGNENLLVETARDFCRMYDNEMKALEGWLRDCADSEEALNNYRIKVHSMKTSASIIGNISLAGLAKTLEYGARDKKMDTIVKLTPVFLENWKSFGEEIKSIYNEFDVKNKKPVNCELICNYLEMLKGAIQDMEIDAADEIMVQLKEFDFSDELMLYLDKLESAVSNIDEEEVEAIAEEFAMKVKES